MSNTTEPECRPDLFMHTLKEMRDGRAQSELSKLLSEVVKGVRDVGKKGSLTLKIHVTPIGSNSSGQYELRGDITSDVPKFPVASTIFFGTPQGNLQRNDPNQTTLNFTEVPNEQPTQFKNAQEAT